jgi:hypothetical protein
VIAASLGRVDRHEQVVGEVLRVDHGGAAAPKSPSPLQVTKPSWSNGWRQTQTATASRFAYLSSSASPQVRRCR